MIRYIWPVPVMALGLSITFANPVWAQTSYYESEPNNTPSDANPVAGAITIIGDLDGQDQDAFMWSVSDVDAQKRWTFELEGMPGKTEVIVPVD